MSTSWPPPNTPVLGMGTSRIASLGTRASSGDIARLLDQAYACGIRVFDTADIYGQGDSERRLATTAAKPNVAIVTKAGLALNTSQTLIRIAKPFLRPVLGSLRAPRTAAAEMRQRSEVNDLDPAQLMPRLQGSLKRLKRECVEVFLLHSPPLAKLEDGTLYDFLDRVREQGLAVATGVSVRSLADGAEVIASGRIQVVELPLNALTLTNADPILRSADACGVAVIAREVLVGAQGKLGTKGALLPLLNDPRLSVVLTGTTSAAHLEENVEISKKVKT